MGEGGTPPRIYWDSSCFLSILNREDEADACIAILEEAERGDIELVISPLTMAETVRPRSAPKPIPREVRDTVLRFFDAEYIRMANFNREMARLSLELCWEQNLKPRDALHLAMALHTSCEVFESKDSDFLRLAEEFRGRIIIRKPCGTGRMELIDHDHE